MDKKNTMLLTVIAVATLLVAVVGATFAYFSIVQGEGGGTSATKFQGTTEGVDAATFGTASLTDHTDDFYIALTAADMSQVNAGDSGKAYYATNVPNQGDGVVTSNKNDAETFYKVATAVIDGGTANKKFRCTSTATISAGDGENTLKEVASQAATAPEGQKMLADDGSIKFQNSTSESGTNHVYFYKSGETISSKAESLEYDLLSLLTAESTTFTIVYDITTATSESEAPSVKGQAGFEAALKIVNRNATQNYLAGKKLSLKVDTDDFVCSNVENFD